MNAVVAEVNTTMADGDKDRENKSPAPGPGDPDWEQNTKVLRGEVDPTDPNKGSGPAHAASQTEKETGQKK